MTYVQQQLAKVQPDDTGIIRVQFSGGGEKTNHLNIDKSTFEKLAAVLTEPVLKTYKNPNKRVDYKCTYIAALQTTGVLPEGLEHFVEAESGEIVAYDQLYRVGDVQYLGRL
jgi:hypothetical protein